MKEFLETVASPGLLKLPLPGNNTDLVRKELFDYLEKACFVRPWSPGKIFVAFNITGVKNGYPLSSEQLQRARSRSSAELLGTFDSISPQRLARFSLNRTLVPYDAVMHAERAIFFPGHEENRLLTHFYSLLFFAEGSEDRRTKRFMRDRLRYHDSVSSVVCT